MSKAGLASILCAISCGVSAQTFYFDLVADGSGSVIGHGQVTEIYFDGSQYVGGPTIVEASDGVLTFDIAPNYFTLSFLTIANGNLVGLTANGYADNFNGDTHQNEIAGYYDISGSRFGVNVSKNTPNGTVVDSFGYQGDVRFAQAVPEPSTLGLLLMGGAALYIAMRKKVRTSRHAIASGGHFWGHRSLATKANRGGRWHGGHCSSDPSSTK